MALFKGHTVGSGFAENVNLLNSAEASEAELAELGNESLASDLDGQDFSLANFGSLLHHEIEPIRSRLDSTGQTVTGIAETLYQIQDGINNLCCNVTQMKSKVLSNFESENSLFVAGGGPDQGQAGAGEAKTEERLELVKDGVPVGEPEHLVERMMTKLDSALRRRDENMKNVMVSLEEDNKQLRQELELYRRRETGASEQNQVLESKIQEVLDSMERLGKKEKSPRSEHSERELPPLADGKLPSKFKRRSKSRPKESSESSSDNKHKDQTKLKPRRQNAYENESTSSSESENKEKQSSKSALKVERLQVMVSNTHSENLALKQDLVEQKEKEAELVRRNLELEAQLVVALSPVNEVVADQGDKVEQVMEQQCKEVQTSARTSRRSSTVSSTVGVNTDLPPPPPPLTVQSPSSRSVSQSVSLVRCLTELFQLALQERLPGEGGGKPEDQEPGEEVPDQGED